MNNKNKLKTPTLFKFGAGAFVLYAVFCCTLVGAALYTVAHFVAKYW